MLKSIENISEHKIHEPEVCIIGSGPAAVTLAWYLLDRGVDVLIVEGSRNTQVTGRGNENTLLYNGTVGGQFTTSEKDFLILPTNGPQDEGTKERERVYGGTSTHWGGQCRPLDSIVFEGRPGFPAWPISREDLDPSYEEACAFMQLHGEYYIDGREGHGAGHNFTIDYWDTQETADCARLDLDNFEEAMYQFPVKKLLQFQNRTVGGDTIGESKAHVYLNASLLHIIEDGGRVRCIEVASMTDDPTSPTIDKKFIIRSKIYVLACGAVENARQMLLSEVGNSSNSVGKFLTGHPIPVGTGNPVQASYGSNVTVQQKNTLAYRQISGYGISAIEGRMTPTAAISDNLARCRFSNTGGYYFELVPEAKSQITLSDTDFDLFGQARAVATWCVERVQEHSYNEMTNNYSTSVANLGGGASVQINEWRNILPYLQFNGHHIGTTRMSSDSKDGVVDANLCVHGLENLYVAGSSTFPTAGVSNPTFTIIALSIRLAGHLADKLGKSKSGMVKGLGALRSKR